MNNLAIQYQPTDKLILLPPKENLLKAFISDQDVRESSRAVYRRSLKAYFAWIAINGLEHKNIYREDIITYKEYLLTSGKSALTACSYMTVVRKFYEWLETKRYYPNVAKGIKSPKRKRQFKKQHLTSEKGKELLQYFEGTTLRNYAIVNLLIRTGLRTIELIRLNVGDITYKGGGRILNIHGKGRDEADQFVVLTDKAYLPIQQYLNRRKDIKDTEPLFVSESNQNRGKRLTTLSIRLMVKEGLRVIGLDGKEYSAHSLRHTVATTIIKSGGSIEDAQKVLRHASSTTTQIYTASIEEEMRLKNPAEILIDQVL